MIELMKIGDVVRIRKEEMGLTTEALATLSGVPVGTINKILNGETKAPRYDTLTALMKVFSPEGESDDSFGEIYAKEDGFVEECRNTESNKVSCDLSPVVKKTGVEESNLAYVASRRSQYFDPARQGSYTLTDYYALPDDIRAELIDGELIYMEAPDYAHQALVVELSYLLTDHIRKKNGGCKVLVSPLDVQLDKDNRTMVQPDVIISCAKEQRIKRGIYGAPDMVIEITSASTRKKDYTKKMVKYLEAGVREYWLVDLQKKVIITYYFEEDMIPHIFPFDGKIPVSIFQGECVIDFGAIWERLELPDEF